ncbi:MAG: cysteine-rich small domain-containing protein [Clostridia bacterium]
MKDEKRDALRTIPEQCEYSFFSHKKCEYFPCHKTEDTENFNCLFCYCPLYALGDKCGGNFSYMENGIKDCSNCMLPHKRNSYSYIVSKFSEISKLAAQQRS